MVSIPLILCDWEIIYSYEFDQDTADTKEWTIVNEVNKCYGRINNLNAKYLSLKTILIVKLRLIVS